LIKNKKKPIRVADWILNHLADNGVKNIFLLPGGGAMHLNDALVRETRIEPIPCHHEQVCGIAAEAIGRVGNLNNVGFGVAMVTGGPGATNIITPVTGAWLDSIPMLIISGQVKREDRLNGRPIRQGGAQEVDIITMVKSITKYAVTIENPLLVHKYLNEALHAMKSGRPGPVWIDIPLDVQAALVMESDLLTWVYPCVKKEHIFDISPVLSMLKEAKRPLLLAGHGVRLSGAVDSFRQLVDKFKIPSVLTWHALDLLAFDDPLNIGRPGVVATRAANFAIQNSDLLISIGARLDNVVTAYNIKGFARSARKIVIDIDQHELENKMEMDIDLSLSISADCFLTSLLKSDKQSDYDDWIFQCQSWKNRFPMKGSHVFDNSELIHHMDFVDSFSEAIPQDTLIVTGSAGLAIEFFYAGFRNKIGQRIFHTSALGSMGYGLPASIGACLGNDRQAMIAVESDGSLQLNLQEFATLSHFKLPICLFILNNNGYASIRNTQRNYFQGRYIASGPSSGLEIPSLKKIASVYNLPYKVIENRSSLLEDLSKAQTMPRPCIIDVRLSSGDILEPKCAAIPSADGSMTSMPLEDMSPLLTLEELESEMIVPLTSVSYLVRKDK
jgi:acetolactate synthase I/II/III large subunit